MLSRASSSFCRQAAYRFKPAIFMAAPQRGMTTVSEALTAEDARKVSGYVQIDYTISEDLPVYEAVQKFAAFNIGCLVTLDAGGKMSGVISERDYITKIALLGRTSKDTKVKEVSTRSAKLVTAKLDESVESCMEKMLNRDIRHLPLVDDNGEVVGLISIKDLVKTAIKERENTIKVLSDFALGRGGHFGSE